MKLFAAILFLATAPAFACMNFIAESEIQKAISGEPNAGAKQCGPDDPCVCFDGVDWGSAEYKEITEEIPVYEVRELEEEIPVFEDVEIVDPDSGEKRTERKQTGTKKGKVKKPVLVRTDVRKYKKIVEVQEKKAARKAAIAAEESERKQKRDEFRAIRQKIMKDQALSPSEEKRLWKFVLERLAE